MECLTTLIKSLNRQEIETLKRYLTCFSSRKQAETKTLKLLEIILSHDQLELTDKRCSQLIFRKIKAPAFGMLKGRLYNKVFDCLLIDINLDRNEVLEETDEMIIRLKKKSAIYTQLLYSRPSSPLNHRLLEEIIEDGKKYEHYYAAIEHLRYKKWRLSIRNNKKEFERITKEIEHYEICARAVNRAVDYYYTVVQMNSETSNLDKIMLVSFLEEAVAEVNVDEQITNSLTVKYYSNWLRLAYSNLKEDYIQAKTIALETIELLKQNACIYRKQRIGYMYGNLSRSEIYLRNFETATKLAGISEEFLPAGSINYFITKEQQFIGQLYNESFKEAEKTVNTLITSAGVEVGSFAYSKYVFYKASLFFSQGKYREAKSILLNPLNISRDKSGWEVGIRILRVMTFVELLQRDEGEREIANLKRFIERSNQAGDLIDPRNVMILRIFQGLEKSGFNFNNLDQATIKKLNSISLPEGQIAWKPFTQEALPFHKWMNSKVFLRKKEGAE
jgi:hypothetical protein